METMVGLLLGKVRDVVGNPRNPNVGSNSGDNVAQQFASLVIRSVIGCYAVWGTVVIADLANCEAKRPGECEAQRAELRGAATTIPATLLAWLADSPITPSGIAQKLIARKPRQSSDSDQ